MVQEDSTVTPAWQQSVAPVIVVSDDPSTHIRDYWEEHYHHDTSPREPSLFASDLVRSLSAPALVIDMGCGNGRDSLFFAESGHRVIAVDGSAEAIEHLRQRASAERESRVRVLQADLSDVAAYVQLEALVWDEREPTTRLIVYGRFLLHAVPLHTQDLFVTRMTTLLGPGDEMHLEYRTGDLDAVTYEFGCTHYRRSVDPSSVEAVALSTGIVTARSEVSEDFAPLGDERPLCARTHILG